MFRISLSVLAVALGLLLADSADARKSGGGAKSVAGHKSTGKSLKKISPVSTGKAGSVKGTGKLKTLPPGASTGHLTKFNGKVEHLKGVAPASKYHLKFGKKFSHGYFYKGKHHCHWSHRCWNSYFGFYIYFDPCCACYYYWSECTECYYPITYVPAECSCGE